LSCDVRLFECMSVLSGRRTDRRYEASECVFACNVPSLTLLIEQNQVLLVAPKSREAGKKSGRICLRAADFTGEQVKQVNPYSHGDSRINRRDTARSAGHGNESCQPPVAAMAIDQKRAASGGNPE